MALALPAATHAAQPPTGMLVRHARTGLRIFAFFSSALLLTALMSMLFADLLWRSGWPAPSSVLLGLYTILMLLGAIGCMHGIFGFFLRVFGDSHRITKLGDFQSQDIAGVSTAIIFPVYNEDAARVCEGLRATYRSVALTGQIERFDFFILSDSTNPDKWVEEECRWCDLVREMSALGRIFYRRRTNNQGSKCGNIRDFLSNWGRRYRYFIVFDADSVMRGQTIVDLVRLMEVHPHAGLIQTVPLLANAESLFGRLQQFANRLCAPLFSAGFNYWAQGLGNYWGHNAIIRTEPFMAYCDLPHLPGRKPFGGQILSHDFVEAALLLKEHWEAWLAYDLEGSYEESPQSLIENARRDQRWCQGNLQHAMVLFARGLQRISRIHLLNGIFGYVASPLWLLFLLTFQYGLWAKESSGLSDISVRAFTPWLSSLTVAQHALLIFSVGMTILFIPKILALIDLALDRPRRAAFGGMKCAVASAVVETAFSSLHAPLQMLWHSRFVVISLLGASVKWSTQTRSADGIAWRDAVRHHWGHTILGLVWGAAVWRVEHAVFWWFAPVLAGMVLSIPLSIFTSRSSLGRSARRLGLFLTPEEISPPPELHSLRANMAAIEKSGSAAATADSGLTEAILDPYVNAIHVSLLLEKKINPVYAEELARLGVGSPGVRPVAERLLAKGPADLSVQEKLLILSDADIMSWLHLQIWMGANETLASSWQMAIRRYA